MTVIYELLVLTTSIH